jgi:hypothetical protein
MVVAGDWRVLCSRHYGSFDMPNLSARYRAKALAAEESAKTAPDQATKVAWTEIAIEWHALATKTAVGIEKDLEIS